MQKFKFISLSLLLGILMIGLAFLLWQFQVASFELPGFVAGVVASLLGGIGSYLLIFQGLTAAHKAFFSGLVKGMLLKLLLGLGAIAAVMFLNRAIINEFVVGFFLSYFVFTAFEVYSLMRNLRPENGKPPQVVENIKVSGQNESKT